MLYKLDSFLAAKEKEIKKIKSDYQYVRNSDGEVLISFKDECSETIQFFHEMGDHETYRTVALKLGDRHSLDDIAGKLEQENFKGKRIYDLPRDQNYNFNHFSDLGILLVRIPWWDIILSRISNFPEVEMIHDTEAQWHIPEPVFMVEEKYTAELEHSAPSIIDFQLPEIKKIKGDLGASVKVAVLDTGIDPAHPSFAHLKSKISRQTKDFTLDQEHGWHDGHGHGSHVASIICSLDVDHGPGWGVAPGIDLYVGKVLSDQGVGTTLDIIEAMRWAAVEAKVDIVSMSLGGGSCKGDCLLCSTIDLLTREYGTIFTVSAGNNGQSSQGAAFSTITCPANASFAVAVGAVDRNGRVAPFSSRGRSENPSRTGPDFVAPGVDIIAVRSQGTSMGSPVNSLSTSACGTSMATPHVAGYIAVLLDYYRRVLAMKVPEEGMHKIIFNALDHGSIDAAVCQYSANCGHVQEGKCGRECQGNGRLERSAFKNALRSLGGGEDAGGFKRKVFPKSFLYFAALVLVFLSVVALVDNDFVSTNVSKVLSNPAWLHVPDDSSSLTSRPVPTENDINSVRLPPLQYATEDWHKLLARPLPVTQLQTYPFNASFFKTANACSLNTALLMAVAATASGFNDQYCKGDNAGIMGIGWPLPAQEMGFESQSKLIENPSACIAAVGLLLSKMMKSEKGDLGDKLQACLQYLFSGSERSDEKNTYVRTIMQNMKMILAQSYNTLPSRPLIVFDEKFRAALCCLHFESKAVVPVKMVRQPDGKYAVFIISHSSEQRERYVKAIRQKVGMEFK